MTSKQDQTASPSRFPVFRLAGLVLATAGALLSFELWRVERNPLQAFYLGTYAKLTILPDLTKVHIGIKRGIPQNRSFRVAFAGETVATTASLTTSGSLTARAMNLDPKAFQAWLKQNIFEGQTLTQILRWLACSSLGLFLLLYLAGRHLDRRQLGRSRKGLLLRGPALISRYRFNRKTRGDGLAFRLENRRNLLEFLMPADSGKYLRIRREKEAHHIQIAGDTGSGKSTLVRNILYQIEARENEVAIIFDPDREYIQEFFREDCGDLVLNPKDDRCPYWPIGEEATDEADATPVANGLFPEDPTIQKFFLSHTRAIFAYLLARYKPTVNELAYWMAHPEEIDKRVKGTEHEHTLTVNAAPQRAGILGSLNEAGKPLRMMPTHSEGRRVWTAREWASQRKGWIFITSTPETIDTLRPVQSLWLDMLILKLQTSQRQPGEPRVWMVLDELASLNALPQLHSALTKQRKSDNPIVLGFQGMSQLDALYPKKSETILSQAFTNIVLRTREPRGSRHLSDLIGKAQLERIRENKPARWFQWKQGSYSTERVVDPVVMDSELQGLDDLNGYFVQQDKIVRIRFRPIPKRIIAPALIERIIPTAELRPLDPEFPAIAMPMPETAKRKPRKAKDLVLANKAQDPGMSLFS